MDPELRAKIMGQMLQPLEEKVVTPVKSLAIEKKVFEHRKELAKIKDYSKKIKIDDKLKHDSHTIPIQISPMKAEEKVTLDFKIVAIQKEPKKYRFVPIAFFIWLFVPNTCSFEILS